MKRTPKVHLVSAVLVATSLVVVTPSISQSVESPALSSQKSTLATIQSVAVSGEGANTELLITTSVPVTYTSYKTTAPAKLVVDFSQAVPAENLKSIALAQGAIKQVTVKRFDTDAGVLSRMEIELVQDVDAVITPATDRSGMIRVSFPGFQPAAVASSSPTTVLATPSDPKDAAKVQNSQTPATLVVTDVVGRADGVEILVKGAIGEYKNFRLNNPERVVVDLFGAKVASGLKLVSVNAAGISTARIAGHSDKVRIVLDAQNGGLSDAVTEKTDSGLKVSFASKGNVATNQTQKAQNVKAASASTTTPPQNISKAPEVAKPPVQPEIEMIDFQVVDNVSRVAIKVKGSAVVEQPTKFNGFVSLKLSKAQLPKTLQRSLDAKNFNSPVLRVTPVQAKSKSGVDTIIRVALRTDVDYELRREADMFYLEFKHPAAQPAAMAAQKAQTGKTAVVEPAVEQQLILKEASKTGKQVYTGRKVTLEFADAEVRKIFQLLSEVSNKNFVLGDEVTGTISLKLVNVPWDQALDVILDTKGLDKREEGNIVLIRGKGKFKSLMDEEGEIRKAALKNEPLETAVFEVNYADIAGVETQFKALKTDRGIITSDARTNKIIVKDVKTALDDMQKMLKNLDVPERQVMIEARIVEASTEFARSLGISWLSGANPAGDGKKVPFVQDFVSSFGGLAATAAALGVPGANADIVFGTIGKNVQLAMRLNAAASGGLVRIISTPKVATLNHKSAKITQGQQIPYISATSDKVETKFVEAALSLEVTPHINANGTIVMKIDAKNDAPGSTGNPPPINKKQATTEMLLRDGETTVIGGIYVDQETEGEQGVPWLKDIPFIGHLFKNTEVKKTRTELLIFITPRLLNTSV